MTSEGIRAMKMMSGDTAADRRCVPECNTMGTEGYNAMDRGALVWHGVTRE